MRFKAILRHGVPETITIDGSEANAEAIRRYHAGHGTAMAIRQVRYLNNVVEQDHRAVKRVTCPMLGFKSMETAQHILAGIERILMLRRGSGQVSEIRPSQRLNRSMRWLRSHHQGRTLEPFNLPTSIVATSTDSCSCGGTREVAVATE
jgi:hypothetical protein